MEARITKLLSELTGIERHCEAQNQIRDDFNLLFRLAVDTLQNQSEDHGSSTSSSSSRSRSSRRMRTTSTTAAERLAVLQIRYYDFLNGEALNLGFLLRYLKEILFAAREGSPATYATAHQLVQRLAASVPEVTGGGDEESNSKTASTSSSSSGCDPMKPLPVNTLVPIPSAYTRRRNPRLRSSEAARSNGAANKAGEKRGLKQKQEDDFLGAFHLDDTGGSAASSSSARHLPPSSVPKPMTGRIKFQMPLSGPSTKFNTFVSELVEVEDEDDRPASSGSTSVPLNTRRGSSMSSFAVSKAGAATLGPTTRPRMGFDVLPDGATAVPASASSGAAIKTKIIQVPTGGFTSSDVVSNLVDPGRITTTVGSRSDPPRDGPRRSRSRRSRTRSHRDRGRDRSSTRRSRGSRTSRGHSTDRSGGRADRRRATSRERR